MEPDPSQRIDVHVFPAFAKRLSLVWLRSVAGHALRLCHPAVPCTVGLVIADDETVRLLNLDYRDLDETTDVLAFPLGIASEETGGSATGFLLPPEEAESLGEIVISYPQAVRQARQGRRRVKAEVALLVVHGVLHLLGYDHAEPDEEARMWAKQDQVLASVSLA